MKKRFLAMLLAFAMVVTQMVSIAVVASAGEVTKTYFDIDFESWTEWGDNGFNGAKQSDGTAINHEWGANPWQMAGETDSARGGNVMKVTVPTTGGSNYLFRSRMKTENHPSSYSEVDVLWNEFSVKYEGGFAGFGTNENDEARSIISVNKDGQLALGARWGYNEVGGGDFNAGTIVPGGQLELGKWYDIKVAADFTDPSAGVLAYVWVNGELIADGVALPGFVSGTNWVYNKFYFDQSEDANTVAYIDDVKVYETADFGDLITPDEPDPEPEVPEISAVPDIDNSSVKTVSYFDIDFENWTEWGDNKFNGAKQSDGTEISHEWGANPWQMSATTVVDRTGKVMQVNVPTTGGSNYLFRSRMKVADGHPSSYSDVDVLWNEFLVKYEGGFAGFGTNENDEARSIISVNKDGQLALGARWGYNEVGAEGNFEAGTIVSGGQLELGKWYHIAVAADFTDVTDGILAYVWVNGELIADGVALPGFASGTNWVYNKFYFDQSEDANTVVYIDNVKVFETATLDSHASKDFEISVTFDSSLEVNEDAVTVPADATVADVKALITADGCTLAFIKDGALLEDADTAADATLYVNAANNIGYKCYTLIAGKIDDPDDPEIPGDIADVTKTYFDINFENWTTWGENNFSGAKQSDGTAISHEWGGDPYYISAVEDAIKGGKVMKGTIPTSGGSSDGYLLRSRMRVADGHPSSYTNVAVLWNEFSVKYEGGFVGFGTNENDEARSIISVNKNGQLALGARWGYNEVGGGNFEAGTIVSGGQLELGKWYHIAVAADFTDTTAGVLAYVWVNGELIADGVVIPNFQSGTNWAYNKFYFDQAESEGRVVYLDNIKIYETAHLDNHAAINLTDENPDDYITVVGSEIITPSRATIGDVKAAFPEAEFRFEKIGEEGIVVVTDDSESVSGATAYLYSKDKLAARPYVLSLMETNIEVTVNESAAGENSGAGMYSVGDKVIINAGQRTDGYGFVNWSVEGVEVEDATSPVIEFIITDEEATTITFTANWVEVISYQVEVIGSYATETGAGLYGEGVQVRVDAGDREGYRFDGWTVEGIENIDVSQKVIEFTMDTTPKTFTANWHVIPKYTVEISGSYAEISGAGEYYEGQTVTINAGEKPKAEYNRWKPTGVTLDNPRDKVTTFTMPANNVKIIASWYTYAASAVSGGSGGGGERKAVYKVEFVTNGGNEIPKQEIENGQTLSVETPVKDGFVFEGWYLDEALTEKVTLPYTVSAKTTLYAKWIDKSEVETDHESVSKDEWLNPFDDVKESDWYFEPVRYMYERRYCEGLGWGQFGPDVNLSRSMLVTILYRIENQPASSEASNFVDVEKDSWYANAVAWAAANGIVTGYNNYTFAPDELITREQIAAILYRYAQFKGYSVADSKDISGYSDSYLVSSYAHASLGWAVANGYINGRTETTIAPGDNATRAEALTILYMFIKKKQTRWRNSNDKNRK